MKIGIYQSNTRWLDPKVNIEALEKVLISDSDLELVIMPEMFNTGFCLNPKESSENMDGYTISRLKKNSILHNITIVTSISISENNNHFNRLVVIENGDLKTSYDKLHLFSYGKENKQFTSGENSITFDFKGYKIFPQICYDLRFPEMIRIHNDVDLIINVANWPTKRIHHWNKLLVARAIENQCYIVGCNRTGIDGNEWNYNGHSKVVDHNGDVILNLGDQEQFVSIDIDIEKGRKYRTDFPFQKDKK